MDSPKINYLQTIKNCLSEFQVETKEDCENYAVALNILLTQGIIVTTDAKITRVLSPIKDILDHPENFVNNIKKHQVFKILIRERLATKICDLQTIYKKFEPKVEKSSKEEIDADNVSEFLKDKVINGLTLSEFLEWLIQVFTDPKIISSIGMGPFQNLGISEADLIEFFSENTEEKVQKLVMNIMQLCILMKMGYTLPYLWSLDNENFDLVTVNCHAMVYLDKAGVNKDKFIKLSLEQKQIAINKFAEILAVHGFIPIDELFTLPAFHLATVLSNAHSFIMYLHLNLVTITQFSNCTHGQIQAIFKNSEDIMFFMGILKINLPEFLELNLDVEKIKLWMTNPNIMSIFKRFSIPLSLVKAISTERFNLIAKNIIEFHIYLEKSKDRIDALKKSLDCDENQFMKLIDSKAEIEDLLKQMSEADIK